MLTDFIIGLTLFIGFVSLILPILVMIFNKRITSHKMTITTISFITCAISILLALIYCYSLIKNNDLATLEDTIGGLIFGGSSLLILSIVLNSSLILRYKSKRV